MNYRTSDREARIVVLEGQIMEMREGQAAPGGPLRRRRRPADLLDSLLSAAYPVKGLSGGPLSHR
jgi:hypothetical protein